MKSAVRGRGLARCCGFVDAFVYDLHTPANCDSHCVGRGRKLQNSLKVKNKNKEQAMTSSLCGVYRGFFRVESFETGCSGFRSG